MRDLIKTIQYSAILTLIVLVIVTFIAPKPQEVIAQPLPAIGDHMIEFRATQDSSADFYPASAALTIPGSGICIANDDDDTSIYCRVDGVAADATESNCNTAGCSAMEIKFGEKVCRDIKVTRLSCDTAGSVAFRAWIPQRGGL